MLKIIISICCSCHKILGIGINFRFDTFRLPVIAVSHGYCRECLDIKLKAMDEPKEEIGCI